MLDKKEKASLYTLNASDADIFLAQNTAQKLENINKKINSIPYQKGDKGNKGDKGDKGERGDKGEQGERGFQGNDGVNGKDGKNGINGKNGIDGVDGKDGIDGKNGSPDTAEEVRDKLETLKGEERLDAKYIKNLPKGQGKTWGTIGNKKAYQVSVDTTNFDNNLSSADDTVQKALDTLDELSSGYTEQEVDNLLDEKAELIPLKVIKKIAFNTQEPASPNIGDNYISDPILEATNYNKWSERNVYGYPWNYNDGVSFYENFAPDPFGGNNATKISATSGNSGYHKFQTSNRVQSFQTFETITMSYYLKASDSSIEGAIIGGRTSSENAKFDLVNQVIYSIGSNVLDTGMIDIGNGWFRCWTTFIFQNSIGNNYLYSGIYILGSGLASNFVGTDEGLLIFGSQVQIGGITPYVATNGSVVTETLPLTGIITTTQTFNANDIYTWNGTEWKEFSTYYGMPIFIENDDKPYILNQLGWVQSYQWEILSNLKDIQYNGGNVGIATEPGDDLLRVGGNFKVSPPGSNSYFQIKHSSNQTHIYTGYNGLVFIANNANQGYHFLPYHTTPYPFIVKQNNEYLLYIKGNYNQQGRIGIGTNDPQAKLDVSGGVRIGDDTDTASADKAGTIRYRADANNSYAEMCMQTGASTYAWKIIKQITW